MQGHVDPRAPVPAGSADVAAARRAVGQSERTARNRHRGGVMWLTGLPGAGKSTLARAVQGELFARGYQVYVLDGDDMRGGLNADLGFSSGDRAENVRRVGETAALLADAGMLAIAALISPYRSGRDRARAAVERLTGAGGFQEIHVATGLGTCEARDPKGLYRKAREGEIPDFTGVSAPYEAPERPDLVVDTTDRTVEACVGEILAHVAGMYPIGR